MNKPIRSLISFTFMLVFCFLSKDITAQVIENFDDSNYTVNPMWSGNTNDWTINPEHQLQSNNITAGSTFYLSTSNTLAITAQWEFYIHLAFNTSSANYVDAFLTASARDLTDKNTTGYFIRIGNTADNISLYRKDAGGTSVRIFDGLNGVLNTSNNFLKIKVTCSQSGEWTLYRDMTGTGTSYVKEGTATDLTYTSSAFLKNILLIT